MSLALRLVLVALAALVILWLGFCWFEAGNEIRILCSEFHSEIERKHVVNILDTGEYLRYRSGEGLNDSRNRSSWCRSRSVMRRPRQLSEARSSAAKLSLRPVARRTASAPPWCGAVPPRRAARAGSSSSSRGGGPGQLQLRDTGVEVLRLARAGRFTVRRGASRDRRGRPDASHGAS